VNPLHQSISINLWTQCKQKDVGSDFTSDKNGWSLFTERSKNPHTTVSKKMRRRTGSVRLDTTPSNNNKQQQQQQQQQTTNNKLQTTNNNNNNNQQQQSQTTDHYKR